MDLSIIIVSWNTRELARDCLRSIYQHTRRISFEIFVIDNGSNDATAKIVHDEFKEVQLIVNAVNKGFAAANNQGIQKASGRYILLLNPDTRLIDDSCAKIVNFMDNKKLCGIAGCHLINPDKSHQDSVRQFPGLLDQAWILLKLHHIFPHFKPFERYCKKNFNYALAQHVDQVMGACFMVKREVFKKIGLLDEKNFFNWFEEVDFCKRARDARFEIWYTPDAKIIHHYGQSFNQILPIIKQKMWNKSLRNYFIKHESHISYCIISIFSWLSLVCVYIIQLLTGKKTIPTKAMPISLEEKHKYDP